MNMEITGRHALLFDDDTTAAFVNSENALVEWNSLLIDRYDVRHLLSGPPPSRRRRNPQTSHSSSADAEIDYERYLDLPSPSDEQEEEAKSEGPERAGGFNAVPFSYGNYEDSNNQKTAETESGIPQFYPPFSVPDSLVQNLPPTEKVHQIIARTALFVSKNGGQSEIVLRVKQGDNPTFGFLMPDHHLHPYFRFLVDHQDLVQSNAENEEKKSNTALSLLGSVYGTGEDDEGVVEHASSSSLSKDCASENNGDASGKTVLTAGKDEENVFLIKRNSVSNALKAGRTSSLNKGESSGSVSAVLEKSRASSLPPIPRTEHILVDPSSDMKRLVDKIVEFIIKNGRQFEKVLMEQDRGHGRFPFLIPSNIFHAYYLKVLQKAQESKLTVKSLNDEKEDFRGYISNKKMSASRDKENYTVESDDIPFDSERKEKFKMVINKSKKDGSDLPPKATQPQPEIQVDAAQAAAILQAATRGIINPNLGILLTNGQNEAGLTEEQKLKAERLKRAKMFVAQLKSGAAPSKAEPSRGLSAEPQVSLAKEKERSSTPSDFDILDKRVKSENERLNEEKRAKRKYRSRSSRDEGESSETHDDDGDEREEKRSRRHHKKKHRSRDHSLEHESEEKYVETQHHKSSRKKKHRSSSSYDNESEQEYSRKKHRSRDEESHDEVDSDHKSSRRNRKHRSRYSSHDEADSDRESSRRNRKHRSRYSSHDEVDSDRESSRRNRKHRSRKSSRHSKDKLKHRKGSNSEKDELEEGEISSKLSGQSKGELLGNGVSREPSVDVSSQATVPPAQPVETTDVPDDLRAKIRAMLMSTM